MTNIITIDKVQQFKNDLKAYAQEFPVESCLISNICKKMFDEIEKDCKPKAVDYWQNNKELPFWFIVEERRSPRKYHFEEDEEWVRLNNALEEREAKLKQASDLKLEGKLISDEMWEYAPTVSVDFQWVVYSFKKK